MPDFDNFVTLGFVQNKTSQNSITFTVAATGAAAGALLTVLVGLDNIETGDVEDGTDVLAVSDSKGNTYLRGKLFTNGQAAAGTGVTVGVYYSTLNSELVTGDTITATFNGNVTAKAMTIARVAITPGKIVTVGGTAVRADDASDPGAISISGMPSREYFYVYAVAKEGNLVGITHDANYSILFTATGTGGGTANTNIALAGAVRVFESTGDTVDVTWGSQDHAQALVAFYLEEPPTPGDETPPNVYQLKGSFVIRFELGLEE